MNSKNLSKAINRMLAFLLSVAMIATSSFVTPVLADDADVEGIEVVSEIGSEDTSDTVMTTDDSTDDIIVENLEEGGEDLSDAHLPDGTEGPEQITSITMPKVLTKDGGKKTFDAVAITKSTLEADTWALNADGQNIFDKGYANVTTCTTLRKLTDASTYEEGMEWVTGTNCSDALEIKGAGIYRYDVDLSLDSSNNDYVGSDYCIFSVEKYDISQLSSVAKDIFDLTWKSTKGVYTWNSTKGEATPVALDDVDTIKGDNTKAKAAKISDEMAAEIDKLQTATTATIVIDGEKLIPASEGDDSLSVATPLDGEGKPVAAKMPKVKIKIKSDGTSASDFDGSLEIPFTIGKSKDIYFSGTKATDSSGLTAALKTGVKFSTSKTVPGSYVINSGISATENGGEFIKIKSASTPKIVADDSTESNVKASIFDEAPAINVNANGEATLSYKVSANQTITTTPHKLVTKLTFDNYKDVTVTIEIVDTKAAEAIFTSTSKMGIAVTAAKEDELPVLTYQGSTAFTDNDFKIIKDDGTVDINNQVYKYYKAASADQYVECKIANVKDVGDYMVVVAGDISGAAYSKTQKFKIGPATVNSVARAESESTYAGTTFASDEDGKVVVALDLTKVDVKAGTVALTAPSNANPANPVIGDYTIEYFNISEPKTLTEIYTADKKALNKETLAKDDDYSDEEKLDPDYFVLEDKPGSTAGTKQNVTVKSIADATNNTILHKGQPYAVITGIGNFTGSVKVAFDLSADATNKVTAATGKTFTKEPGKGKHYTISLKDMFTVNSKPVSGYKDTTIGAEDITGGYVENVKVTDEVLSFDTTDTCVNGKTAVINFTPEWEKKLYTIDETTTKASKLVITVNFYDTLKIHGTDDQILTFDNAATGQGPKYTVTDAAGKDVTSDTTNYTFTETYYEIDKATTVEAAETENKSNPGEYVIRGEKVYKKAGTGQKGTKAKSFAVGDYAMTVKAATKSSIAAGMNKGESELKTFFYTIKEYELADGDLVLNSTGSAALANVKAGDAALTITENYDLKPYFGGKRATTAYTPASDYTLKVSGYKYDKDGVVTHAIVTATAVAKKNIKGSANIEVSIKATELTQVMTTASGANPTLTITLYGTGSYEYTGSEIKPLVKKIEYDADGTGTNISAVTIPSTMYDLKWKDNINVADTNTIEITFKGSYKGTVTKTFTITNKNTGITKKTETVNVTDKQTVKYTLPNEITADGKTVNVTYANPASWTEGTHYKDQSGKIGSISIASGILQFTIAEGATKDQINAVEFYITPTVPNYSSAAADKAVTIKLNYIKAEVVTLTVAATDKTAYDGKPVDPATYTVTNSKSETVTDNFKGAISIKWLDSEGKEVTTKSGRPEEAGTYTVIAKLNKEGYLAADASAKCNIKQVRIQNDSTTAFKAKNVEYNGKNQLPVITITGEVNGESYKLVKDKDYVVKKVTDDSDNEVTDYKDVNSYKVVVEGKGNFVFTASLGSNDYASTDVAIPYQITKKQINVELLGMTWKGGDANINQAAIIPKNLPSPEIDGYTLVYTGTADGNSDVTYSTDDGTTKNTSQAQAMPTGTILNMLVNTADFEVQKIGEPTTKIAAANYDIVLKPGKVKIIALADKDKYYDVTFMASGEEVDSVGVCAGKTIIEENPDFSVDGISVWYSDPDMKKVFDITREPINGTMTLYGAYQSMYDDEIGNAKQDVLYLFNIPDQEYTGNKIKPANISVTRDDYLLKNNTDYKVNTKQFDKINVNSDEVPYYTVDIYVKATDKTYTVPYYIVPKNIGSGVKLSSTALYTINPKKGSKVTVKPVASLSYKKKLVAGTDYEYEIENLDTTAEYIDTTGAPATVELGKGDYKLTVYGIGNYTGKIERIISVAESKDLLSKSGKITINAAFKSREITPAYPAGGRGIRAPFTITVNKTKTYRYDEGNAAWMLANNGWDSAEADEAFNTPVYSNVTNVGKATVTVTAKPGGPYAGTTKAVTYTIKGNTSKKLSKNMLIISKDIANYKSFDFTGKAWTIEEVLKKMYSLGTDAAAVTKLGQVMNTTAVYGQDYYVTYKKNVEAGTATMTFVGIPAANGFYGSFSQTFKIQKVSLGTEFISGGGFVINLAGAAYLTTPTRPDNILYKGVLDKSTKAGKNVLIPTGTIIFENQNTGMPLVEGKDYTLKYDKTNKAGSTNAVVKVVGKGSYSAKGAEITISFDTTQ